MKRRVKRSSRKVKKKIGFYSNIKKSIKGSFFGKVVGVIRDNQWLFFSIIAIFILLLFLFGAKIYLLLNFVLGNDTLVKLTTDKQDFFMVNSEVQEVKFEAYVSTNIFCEATCDYHFKNLGSGEVLDRDSFNTKFSNPSKFKYLLLAPEKGEGQNLYSFEITCSSEKTGFCKTSEAPRRRSYLIAVNYELSDDEKVKQNKSRILLEGLAFDLGSLMKMDLENENNFRELSNRIILDNVSSSSLDFVEGEFDSSLESWDNYNYDFILGKNYEGGVNEAYIVVNSIGEDLHSKIELYNDIIYRVESLGIVLNDLVSRKNISIEDYNNILSFVGVYNSIVFDIEGLFNIDTIDNILNKTFSEVNGLLGGLNQSFLSSYSYMTLSELNVSEIESFDSSNYSFIKNILDPNQVCCYDGDCGFCCDEVCRDDSSLYPVILLHGHSFNNKVSAESSLGDLDSIQQALIGDGYVDGGYVLVRNLEKIETFARTNRPIVFSTSYYFDIYQTKEKDLVLQTKGDSLDTYAVRLNDIIENVKMITGKDKVVVVAHSMGGLVSRRYLQVFGDDSVDKLIMIGTPNFGVDGYILTGCSLLGADLHCDAMDKDSLFLNKLNYGIQSEVDMSMIIGIGCDMKGEASDGIVTNASAYFSGADNYYVNGTCNGVSFFHQTMLDVERYPKVYEIIKSKLGV